MSELVRAINSLSTCLNNPASGGGSSFRLNEASEVLSILGRSGYDEDSADFGDLADLLEELATQGRGPSPSEWNGLHAWAAEPVEEESVEEEEEPTTESEPLPQTGEAATVEGEGESDPTTEQQQSE